MATDGYLFYWLMWILFVICYFFIVDKKQAMPFCYIILALMVLNDINIDVFDSSIQLALVLLVVIGLLYVVRIDNIVLTCSKIFIIMVSFCTVHLWEATYSLSLFIPMIIFQSLTMLFLINILSNTLRVQLIITVLGLSLGQILFDLILLHYGFTSNIGSMYFLDLLTVIVCLLIIRNGLTHFKAYLNSKINQIKTDLEQDV